jgi:hypothetical protein
LILFCPDLTVFRIPLERLENASRFCSHNPNKYAGGVVSSWRPILMTATTTPQGSKLYIIAEHEIGS